MNKNRLLVILIAVIGLVSSTGCGKTQSDDRESQNNTAVETDMNIVIPDSTEQAP